MKRGKRDRGKKKTRDTHCIFRFAKRARSRYLIYSFSFSFFFLVESTNIRHLKNCP